MLRLFIIFIFLTGVFFLIGVPVFRHFRRKTLQAKPLDPRLKEFAWRNVPVLSRLPDKLQKQLEGLVNIFLTEKKFTGFNGLKITHEMRVTIAAQACLLLLNRRTNHFKHLKNIYLYPDRFGIAENISEDGVTHQHYKKRLGESWTYGPVVLSWADCLEGGISAEDGRNLVFHEFAHQLDQEDGYGDGVPSLGKLENYSAWAKILTKEYHALVDAHHHKTSTLIDHYGAVNPAEFFAVITETFFEQPNALKKQHPKLYEQLSLFYHLDMADILDA